MVSAARRLRFTPLEIATIARAATLLVVVEVLVRVAPLPKVSRWLGVRLDVDSEPMPTVDTPTLELPDRAERQVWAAWQLAERWPFSDGPCLRRSLVAGRLLRRHDPTLRLGVAPQGDGILAHAWLEIDGEPIEDLGDLRAFQRHEAS